MPDQPEKVHWEQLSKNWWSSSIGSVRRERGVWTAFVYKNTRAGEAYTESKTGFDTAIGAMRWVENKGET